jgi:hypothetical protein
MEEAVLKQGFLCCSSHLCSIHAVPPPEKCDRPPNGQYVISSVFKFVGSSLTQNLAGYNTRKFFYYYFSLYNSREHAVT